MTTSSIYPSVFLHHATFIFLCFSRLSAGTGAALYPLESNTSITSKKSRHFAEVKALLLLAPLIKQSSVKKNSCTFSHSLVLFTKFKLRGNERKVLCSLLQVSTYLLVISDHITNGFVLTDALLKN